MSGVVERGTFRVTKDAALVRAGTAGTQSFVCAVLVVRTLAVHWARRSRNSYSPRQILWKVGLAVDRPMKVAMGIAGRSLVAVAVEMEGFGRGCLVDVAVVLYHLGRTLGSGTAVMAAVIAGIVLEVELEIAVVVQKHVCHTERTIAAASTDNPRNKTVVVRTNQNVPRSQCNNSRCLDYLELRRTGC